MVGLPVPRTILRDIRSYGSYGTIVPVCMIHMSVCLIYIDTIVDRSILSRIYDRTGTIMVITGNVAQFRAEFPFYGKKSDFNPSDFNPTDFRNHGFPKIPVSIDVRYLRISIVIWKSKKLIEFSINSTLYDRSFLLSSFFHKSIK